MKNESIQILKDEFSEMLDYLSTKDNNNTVLTVEICAKLWGEQPTEITRKFKQEL